MGYPYSTYAVDLKKLAALAGSQDKKLAAALAKKFKRDFADNAESFEDEIAEGAPTLEVAVAEIIAGNAPKKSKHGFQYGYAAEVLTRWVGTRIDDDELGLGCQDAIDPFLKKAKKPKMDALMKHDAFPIKFPAPADFPGFGALDVKDIATLVFALDAIANAIADDPAKEVADALRSWCTKATKKKLGMVWFYY